MLNHVSLRSVFHVVMFATVFTQKRCSVRPYLQLFAGGISVLFTLFTYSGVQHILCCVFSIFVLCIICCKFSGLSILIASSVFSNVYLIKAYYSNYLCVFPRMIPLDVHM
jgi:hypothetical protein